MVDTNNLVPGDVSTDDDVIMEGDFLLGEPEICFPEYLIEIYTSFRDQVYNPKSVLYPCCGVDASPARVFDDVTFIDNDLSIYSCVRNLQEAGFKAFRQDARDYKPEELHDLLILLRAPNLTEWVSGYLRSGGYVLTDDRHGNATNMYENSDEFTLWGTIDFVGTPQGNGRVKVSRNLENLFQPVKDAEEFQRLRPDAYEAKKAQVELDMASETHLVGPNATFEQIWAVYREALGEGMPSKRVADRYIFVKK